MSQNLLGPCISFANPLGSIPAEEVNKRPVKESSREMEDNAKQKGFGKWAYVSWLKKQNLNIIWGVLEIHHNFRKFIEIYHPK